MKTLTERPMTEAPRDGTLIVARHCVFGNLRVRFESTGEFDEYPWTCGAWCYHYADFECWWPMLDETETDR